MPSIKPVHTFYIVFHSRRQKVWSGTVLEKQVETPNIKYTPPGYSQRAVHDAIYLVNNILFLIAVRHDIPDV